MSTAAVATHNRIPDQRNAVNPEDLSETDQKTHLHVTQTLAINIGWQIVKIGLDKEKIYYNKLNRCTNTASEMQQTIQKLIELNGQLPISEKDVGLSDQALALCKDLEKANIILLQPGEKKISPTRMAELKAQVGAHNDRLKTELQTLFTTKIQVMINELNSLLESLKTIQKTLDRLIENIINATMRK
jgi:hypothetical protein